MATLTSRADEIMEGIKAQVAAPISQSRLAELLATRERAKMDDSDLVIDGWD